MSRILLAVSDRWVPDVRVDAIADFVQRLGGSILAVHIAYGTENEAADVSPGERLLDQIAKQLRNKVSPPGTPAGQSGGPTRVDTLFLFSDDIGAAILKTADEHRATMIVLGLSSKGVLTRLIEGNVAQEVIRGARIPVLLLPSDWMSAI